MAAKHVFRYTAVGLATLISATMASAQTLQFGTIDANIAIDIGTNDVGNFSSFVLGQDIELLGCFSRFNFDGGGSSSVCYEGNDPDNTLTTLVDFNWLLTNNDTNTSVSFSGPGSYSVPLSTGGVTDFINAVGSYTLTLTTTSFAGDFLSLSPVGDAGVQIGGVYDQETANFTVTSSTSVPEPASALLLVPALALIRRRQKQLKHNTAHPV